ncbi:hypothetical protein NDU88_007516 [Pleurodeles waltl]|uniref:Uncharacterized protein n=1 Tax=Pleurodeles waltl TaxID=8319 RepID=A0AAV7LSC0_PLEWA|nr:hypothetical protein NDU88_007516 [Pleurodeles waltl]
MRSGTSCSLRRGPLKLLVPPYAAVTKPYDEGQRCQVDGHPKNAGKPARQLLFSEVLLQAKGVPPPTATQPSATHQEMADPAQEPTTDHILQEISAVGRRLEGMDSAIVSMAAETKSIRTEIASFQTRVLGLEQRVSKVEAHASSFQDRDQELLFLHSKLTDLEDRS